MRPHLVAFIDRLLGGGAGEVLAPNYLVMLSLAIVAGTALAVWVGRAHGFDMRRGLAALALAYPGALAGARLFTVASNVPDALAAADVALLWRGGLAAYGGFMGGVFGAWLALRRGELTAFGDVCAPTMGLGTCLTRLGCFVAGCDFGVVTGGPWGVRFPPGSPAFRAHAAAGWVGPFSGGSLPVHPTELYESALGLAICTGALFWMRRRRGAALDGRVFLGAIAAYAVGRFAVERLRGDVDRGVFFGALSTSQLVSLGVLALVAVVAVHRFGRRSAWRLGRPVAAALAACAAGGAGAALTLGAPGEARAAAPTVALVDRLPATTPGAATRGALLELVAGSIGTGRVLAPVTVRSILEDKGVVPEKVVDPASWAALAALLRVDLVAGVTIEVEGEGAGLDATLYNRKGKTLFLVHEPCPLCSPTQLEDAARSLASRLADAVVGKTPGPPAGLSGRPAPRAVPPESAHGGGAESSAAGRGSGGGGAAGFADAGGGAAGAGMLGADVVAGETLSGAFSERHPLAVRLGLGPSFVIGRRTVPTLGYQFLVEGSYTLRSRTELGAQFIYFLDADSKHFTFAATFEWKIGRALKSAPYAGGSVGITHVVFDDAPKSVTAFDTRARLGWEILFGKWFGLRLELLNLSWKISAAFGSPFIPAWEPRILVSYRH
ncbi:MAG TPA: prolipoprotein diacylglyceryl transferase family protein [Myxococcota bacterium]|jgi:phosphatidylglycerol:prolipoprotein diacylglycerol transferase|nr:prolipoprotein diacylglyceryl transferase family protein [Myxococcota bacterium]